MKQITVHCGVDQCANAKILMTYAFLFYSQVECQCPTMDDWIQCYGFISHPSFFSKLANNVSVNSLWFGLHEMVCFLSVCFLIVLGFGSLSHIVGYVCLLLFSVLFLLVFLIIFQIWM